MLLDEHPGKKNEYEDDKDNKQNDKTEKDFPSQPLSVYAQIVKGKPACLPCHVNDGCLPSDVDDDVNYQVKLYRVFGNKGEIEIIQKQRKRKKQKTQ